MASVGGAGGDGVDPGGDGDQLRLLGLLVGDEIVAGSLAGGAQLPGDGVGPGQGAGMVVGPGAAVHAPPRRAAPLRRLRPRRLRRAVRLAPRLPHRPIPTGACVVDASRPSLVFFFLCFFVIITQLVQFTNSNA